MRILGTGFFCIFAPFNAAQSLMTSSTSWGSYNLAVLYATFSLTCVITPRIVTTIGARLAMIIGKVN